MACYKKGGCGSYEMYSCSECPASKPEYLDKYLVHTVDWAKLNYLTVSEEQFTKIYCNNCGTQRCEGINSEWFDGCKFKDHLRRV